MKKNFSRILIVLGLTLLFSFIAVGCNGSNSDTSEVASTVEITDLEGNVVEVPTPENLDTMIITSWKGALPAAVLLGQEDKIIGMSDISRFVWLRQAVPEVDNLKDYGAFEDVNVEEILEANPDVVISPVGASQANDSMKSFGITVVVDGVDIDDSKDVFKQTYDEIDLVAKLTGSTDIADKYYKWADDLFKLVDDRVKDIPEDERVRVIPLRNDILQVYGNNSIWGYLVEMAGGINVCGDSTQGTGKFFADVDPEQIAKWNPDMMFQYNFNKEFTDEVAGIYQGWKNEGRFSTTTAFANDDVYLIPLGISSWNSQIEGPLGALWMAKIMYPDLFSDIDVKEYAEDFYKEFLDYEMTDKDWELMAPQYEGANDNGLN